jgi:hypothetical protein
MAEKTKRSSRARRLLAMDCGLVAIGAVLLVGFALQGADSSRFVKLREGMTHEQVKLALSSRTVSRVIVTTAKVNGQGFADVQTFPKYRFAYSENSLFPGFCAIVTF